jgi:uncharacterized membrane protein
MEKKKRNDNINAGDWEDCPECGKSVKSKNLNRHLKKVHSDLSKKEIKNLKSGSGKKRISDMNKTDRRRELMKQKRKKEDMVIFSALGIIIIGIVAGYFILTSGGGNDSDDYYFEPTQQAPEPTDKNEVRIPSSDINDGQAYYYEYDSGGKEIRYFVLKSSDGVFRAAFDACDVCFQEKRGYRQEGDDMVCNNCGQRFPSTKINVIKGGCNPAPLTRTDEGSELVIKTSDIEAGRKYFP